MDFIKKIDGEEYVFCVPASHYVANLIKKDQNPAFDIEVVLSGTGAILKKYSKKKIVDHHDPDCVSFIRANIPPVEIGGFYWEVGTDAAVYNKTNTDKENEQLQKNGMVQIPYIVFKHLRPEDWVEIKGKIIDSTGKERNVLMKAKKSFIERYVHHYQVEDDMSYCEIHKDKFIKKFIEIPTKKTKNRR